jgi:chemotaxis protein methyltransferase CheR
VTDDARAATAAADGAIVRPDQDDRELDTFLDAVRKRYGYDFRDYARAHLTRRLRHRLALSGLDSLAQLQQRVIDDSALFAAVLDDLSIRVTEMFRDPHFFLAFRHEVVPHLKTYPFIRVWHAGCATGEEVYSMAIILAEEGVLDRCRLYATDLSSVALDRARKGILPLGAMQGHTARYQRAGGRGSFADYYTARYGNALIDPVLLRNVVFADHNLVTDSAFGEMNLIVCRNVVIYFNRRLQNRVCRLFADSLAPGGFLCVGAKESLQHLECRAEFDLFNRREKIYRKRYGWT